ncbi:hypothetical protein ZWY2020_003540 [Hordeum vulgare]|nr:hypothetical protein ZWY2020_003540 [Hordeum vulgare]
MPMLVSEGYAPPFADVLRWESFSVSMPVADIPRLKEVLEGKPTAEVERLREGVRLIHHFCAHLNQDLPPHPSTAIHQIHQHLCTFHFYGDDMTRHVETHHFCAHLNEDVRQCLIFDGPDADARLIGLEYIIVEELFLTLPDEEKPLWHTHEFEVRGGVLFMRVVPDVVEHRDLDKVARTYGKTVPPAVDHGGASRLACPGS